MTKKTDLTAVEASAAFEAFAAEVGPKATTNVFLNTGKYRQPQAFTVVFSPDGYGVGDNTRLTTHGNTFREAIDNLKVAWEQHKADHYRSTIKKMALAVIEITSDLGECSDRALRGHGFSGHDVQMHHAAAAELANEMSGKGPFSVVLSEGANEHAEAA